MLEGFTALCPVRSLVQSSTFMRSPQELAWLIRHSHHRAQLRQMAGIPQVTVEEYMQRVLPEATRRNLDEIADCGVLVACPVNHSFPHHVWCNTAWQSLTG